MENDREYYEEAKKELLDNMLSCLDLLTEEAVCNGGDIDIPKIAELAKGIIEEGLEKSEVKRMNRWESIFYEYVVPGVAGMVGAFLGMGIMRLLGIW